MGPGLRRDGIEEGLRLLGLIDECCGAGAGDINCREKIGDKPPQVYELIGARSKNDHGNARRAQVLLE
jgi:hypothetical protein